MRERGCDIIQVAVVATGDAVQRRSLKVHDVDVQAIGDQTSATAELP
jgi:hypothetical protein